MAVLANYSIETDQTVLLSFADGRRVRVPLGQLAQHLEPADLIKVQRALELRRSFIKRHMPRTLLAFTTSGLMALFTLTTNQTTAWIQPHPEAPAEAPSPEHAETIVRDSRQFVPAVIAPSPSLASSPKAAHVATRPSARTATSSHPARKSAALGLSLNPAPKNGTPVASIVLPTILPIPLPSVIPAAPIKDPAPTPSESPEPTPSSSPDPQSLGEKLPLPKL